MEGMTMAQTSEVDELHRSRSALVAQQFFPPLRDWLTDAAMGHDGGPEISQLSPSLQR